MENLKNFLKAYQQPLVLTIGYLLVACLAFGLGRYTLPKQSARQVSSVKVQEASATPLNYNPNSASIQSASDVNCAGKIKGSASLIYHVPGGAFYNKTSHPIRCFNSEAEAKAAGFRKSSR
ncbi:MAG: hypothetical protein ABI643_02390 [Candidatus Doudnabacteria bacterium]